MTSERLSAEIAKSSQCTIDEIQQRTMGALIELRGTASADESRDCIAGIVLKHEDVFLQARSGGVCNLHLGCN